MKFFLLVVIAVLSCAAGQKNFFRSDYIFLPEFNSWLKFHREPLPWHLARRRCEYEGSKLGTPANNEYVTMFKEVMSTYNVSELYTGVHATFGRGDYFSIDGKPFTGQHMWRRDGLKYSREARCVTLDSNGQLASVSCDNDYPFICAKKFVHLKTTECGTTDPAYNLENSTGSCYKLHRERKDWNTAVSVCNAEGGYLAIPSDASEAQVLAKMATEDETYIGYLNWEDENWYTVHESRRIQDPKFRSDYIFLGPIDDIWVKFHREPLPWHLARRVCQYQGSRLVTPMNSQNASYLKEVQLVFNVNEMYTGAHSTFGLGEFYTVDGIPYMGISQHMWRRDGLSYSHKDRCVIIDSKGLLSSVKCDEGYPFMCSKKFAHLTVTGKASCYKLHREHEDWNTAVSVCTAEGGYLAIPSDASEAQLLADMTTEDETFIGYMNWEGTRISDKIWHTLHGDYITYTRWADQDPFDIVSACGAIKKKSALLRKLPCGDRKPFICEKNVSSLTIYPRNRVEGRERSDEN